MKNKIKKTNKISNRSRPKKLSSVSKKLNKKMPFKAMVRKVTIDELALMIGKGFRGVDERFDKMDERIDGMDERFDRMDKRFDKMDERFDRMELKLDSLERRIFAIEDLLTEHRKILNEHGKDIKEIKDELKSIKKAGDNDSGKIIELDRRIRALESKVAV